MKPPATAETSATETNGTGLPFLRSWNAVYLFVLASFVLWVALLIALTRMFS